MNSHSSLVYLLTYLTEFQGDEWALTQHLCCSCESNHLMLRLLMPIMTVLLHVSGQHHHHRHLLLRRPSSRVHTDICLVKACY